MPVNSAVVHSVEVNIAVDMSDHASFLAFLLRDTRLTYSIDTKERPFKCLKCRSTFVRRDLLLRHDRTVHAKDGGIPLQTADSRRRASTKASPASAQSPHSITEELKPLGNENELGLSNSAYLGLQEAAMLMTNFQQKAAMTTQPNGHDPSVSTPQMYDTPGPYASNNMSPTSQMQWATLAQHNASTPHDHTPIDPSIFAPLQDARPFDDALDPAISAARALVSPELSSLATFPPTNATSGLVTPDSYSPYPPLSAVMSSTSQLTKSSRPIQQAMKQASVPQITTDEQMRRLLANIEHFDSTNVVSETVQMPEAAVLNRYLSTYFTLFHHHLPFLHPASFDPAQVCSPLLLAVLSVGALYTFEQNHAYMLHIGSKLLVNQFLANKENFSSRKSPLWAMQATLLNMVFASWSGDIRGLEWACSIKSLVANMVAGNRYELKLRSQARAGSLPTHAEWIEDEQCRRTYYAVYIYFGLLTMTFNHTPAISFNEFEGLELPSSESLWNLGLADVAAWQEMSKLPSAIKFKEAHHAVFQGQPVQYSAFATRIMINALFLEVWYHKRSPEALQDAVTEYKLRLALETWQTSLGLCEVETVAVQLSTPHKGHPLIFNAMAMYRNTIARLLVDLAGVQEALRYHNSAEVASAMGLAMDKVRRSDDMLKVIQACFDCIEIAALQGIRWVARTSATNWSVEHPLCGFDLVLILTHWTRRIEHDGVQPTQAESDMYDKIRRLFEDETKDGNSKQLSATVARLWGSMIDEVVVWGYVTCIVFFRARLTWFRSITKLMGESFKIHARALSGAEPSPVATSAATASFSHEVVTGEPRSSTTAGQ